MLQRVFGDLSPTLNRRIKPSVARKSRRFILREVHLKMDGVARRVEPSLSLFVDNDTSSNHVHNSDTRSNINLSQIMRVYKNNTSFKI